MTFAQKEKYIQNFLLSLFPVYFAQGSLYPKGSILSQLAILLILGISSFYFIKTLFLEKGKDAFYNIWTIFFFLNIIGFLLTGFFYNIGGLRGSMFRSVYTTMVVFYPFYYFTKYNILTSKHLVFFLTALIPVFILYFYFQETSISRISGKIEVVNNVAYFFAGLIPYVFLLGKKKLYAASVMLLLLYYIIESSKRGAVIIGGIGFLFFIYYQLCNVPQRHKFKAYFLTALVVASILYYGYNIYINNDLLMHRMELMEEGNGSGRNIIYKNIFNSWLNGNSYIHLLFGYGFASSLILSGTGNYAHNDWLELLSNFGLVGVIIYLSLFFVAVKKWFSSNWERNKNVIFLCLISMWFITSLFSMTYSSGDTGYLRSILLAFLLGGKRNGI